MKPLKIDIRQDKKIIENEKEILEGYQMKYFVSFIPDFLLKHAYKSKDTNNDLKYYLKEKKKYTYIATWYSDKEPIISEYYYDKDCNIVCYLIYSPEAYYPSLQSVMIYKKTISEVS